MLTNYIIFFWKTNLKLNEMIPQHMFLPHNLKVFMKIIKSLILLYSDLYLDVVKYVRVSWNNLSLKYLKKFDQQLQAKSLHINLLAFYLLPGFFKTFTLHFFLYDKLFLQWNLVTSKVSLSL